MNKQLALAYAATSVATAIAAIAVVGSALGFGGLSEPPVEEPVGVAQSVTDLRDSLVQQAVAQVEAQRAEAQAAALVEVEAWRAAAVAEIEQQLAEQYGSAAIAGPSVAGAAYAMAYYDDDDDEHEDRDHEDEEDEEDEDDEHEKREDDD